MRTPREKSRWLQGGLIVLIILMLAFLAISPSLRAQATPVQSDGNHMTSNTIEETTENEI